MSKTHEVAVTEVVDGALSETDLDQLAETLNLAVEQGASIGFVPRRSRIHRLWRFGRSLFQHSPAANVGCWWPG
ncbi:hypothetical protein ACVW02_004073 [Ewingella americana]